MASLLIINFQKSFLMLHNNIVQVSAFLSSLNVGRCELIQSGNLFRLINLLAQSKVLNIIEGLLNVLAVSLESRLGLTIINIVQISIIC